MLKKTHVELHDIHAKIKKLMDEIKKLIQHIQQIHANNEENSCRIAAKPKAAEARSSKPEEAKSQKPKPEAKSQKEKNTPPLIVKLLSC